MIEKLGGRKFVMTLVGSFLLAIIPIVYSKAGVDSATTQIVLGSIAAALGLYGAANVMEHKYNPQDRGNPEKLDSPKND